MEENRSVSSRKAAIVVTNINGSDLHGGHSGSYDSYFNSIPPGYRFNPSDEELVVLYLKKKIDKEQLPPNLINDVELYKFSPDILTDVYKKDGHDGQNWYFFTQRDRKYPNGKRPNRAAGDGYWKATLAEKKVSLGKVKVGTKTSLDFYKGKSPKGVRTNWKMLEFKVHNPKANTTPKKADKTNMKLEDLVLCKIYKHLGKKNPQDQDVSDEVHLPTEIPDEQTSFMSEIFNPSNDIGYGGPFSAVPLPALFAFDDPHQFFGYQKRQRFDDLPSEIDLTNYDQWVIDIDNGLPANFPMP